jgi:hypothetical protein
LRSRSRVAHGAHAGLWQKKFIVLEKAVRFILRKLRIHFVETHLTLRRTECQTLARQFDLPESTPEQDSYIKLRWANAMEETRALQLKLQNLVSEN